MDKIERDVYLCRGTVPDPIEYVQCTNAVPLIFYFRDYTIPDGGEARVYIKKPSGAEVYNEASISDNIVTVQPTTQMFAEHGKNRGQLEILKGDTVIATFPLIFMVAPNIIEDSAVKSKDEYGVLEKATKDAEDAAAEARAAAGIMTGKKCIFFGDSITWGESPEDRVQVDTPIPDYVDAHLSTHSINAGVRGATGSGTGSGTFYGEVEDHASDLPDCDYMFVCFGVNDFQNAVTVGKTSEPDTFLGGMYDAINYAYSINNKITLVLMIPPQGRGNILHKYWDNSIGERFSQYANAVMELAAEFNCPTIDLRHVGINSNNAADYYTNGNNHPTQEAYDLFGAKVCSALVSLHDDSEREFYDGDRYVGLDAFQEFSEFADLIPIRTSIANYGQYYYDAEQGDNETVPVRLSTGKYYRLRTVMYNSGATTVTITLKDAGTGDVMETFSKVVSGYTEVIASFYTLTGTYSSDSDYVFVIHTDSDGLNIGAMSLTYEGISYWGKPMKRAYISYANAPYYVDGVDGSDANSGRSRSRAFKTLGKALRMSEYHSELRIYFIGSASEYTVDDVQRLTFLSLRFVNDSDNSIVAINLNCGLQECRVELPGTEGSGFKFSAEGMDGGYLQASYTTFTGSDGFTLNSAYGSFTNCTFDGVYLRGNGSELMVRSCTFTGAADYGLYVLDSRLYVRTDVEMSTDASEALIESIGSTVHLGCVLSGNKSGVRIIYALDSIFLATDNRWAYYEDDNNVFTGSHRLNDADEISDALTGVTVNGVAATVRNHVAQITVIDASYEESTETLVIE